MTDNTQTNTIDLNAITTKSGKKVTDFTIPQEYLQNDPALIELILKAESMDDEERQYWFNLLEIMDEDQVEKLRGILTKERDKLAEIEKKYGKKKELTPEEIAANNAKMEAQKEQQKQALAEQEAARKAKEAEQEANILAELENL